MTRSITVRTFLICLWLLPTLCLASDRAKQPNTALDGIWVLVAQTRDGKKATPAQVKETLLGVSGNKWQISGGVELGLAGSGTLALNAAAIPRQIDVTRKVRNGTSQTYLGIYELRGDRLTITLAGLNKARPARFGSPPKSDALYQVWKRRK